MAIELVNTLWGEETIIRKMPATWVRKRRQYWQDKYKLHKGCEFCGYNKHPRALSFDHLDPALKHPLVKNGAEGISTKAGGMWQLLNPKIPLKVMIAEWRKCRILCMNCHMEDKYGPMPKTT